MVKLSVIVPLLKENAHLKACLDSILIDSLFKDLELLIVLSSLVQDNHKELIEQVCQEDSRVRVLDLKELSYMQALDKAISQVRGEYLAFVPSCDFVHKEFFTHLLASAEEHKTPLVLCDFYTYQDSVAGLPLSLESCFILQSCIVRAKWEVYYFYEDFKASLFGMKYSYSALYQTSLIQDNKLSLGKFSRSLAPFLQQCLVLAEQFSYVKEELYFHRSSYIDQQVDFLASFEAFLSNYELLRSNLQQVRGRNYGLLKQDLYVSQFSLAYTQIKDSLSLKGVEEAFPLLKQTYERALEQGFLKDNINPIQKKFYALLEQGKLDVPCFKRILLLSQIKFRLKRLLKEGAVPFVVPFVIFFRVIWLVSKALIYRRIS